MQYEKWSSLELKVEQGEDPNPEQCHSPNLVDLMSANESLAQHLEEVLHDKTQLEREVKKLAAKLRTLRNTQDHLGQENTSLRVTAELAQEFNVAFHRATREADIAIERISELEHERDTFAKELRIEQQAHRRERQEHEVLLQEFSDLTKLLEEVIKQRDQALADRDLAVQQKLESSIQCAYAEEQLQAAWENSDSFERRRASADEAIIAQLKPSALRLCSSSRTHCEPISPENMSPLVTTEVQASNR